MNSTAEKKAREMIMSVTEPDRVRVKVKVSWQDKVCIPNVNGETEEEAVFSTLTYGDHWSIERAVTRDIEVDGGRAIVGVADLNEYRRLLVKRNLLSWTLDVPIERDVFGWMTPKCYSVVSKIAAPIMEAFVGGYEESIEVSDEEESKISRQSASLFSKNSHGVTDPCEAVTLFCTLGNYWEKFGLDKEKMPRMPYRDYLLLKMMLSRESDANRANAPRPPSTTRVVGAGGRAMPSRGISMPM